MKFLKTLGFTMILIALAFLLAAALFWGLSIGTVKLPLDQIYNSVLEQLMGDLPMRLWAVGRFMILYGFSVCPALSLRRLSAADSLSAASLCRLS